MSAPPRRLRLAHLTTSDISLALLLATEFEADVEAGYETFAVSAAGPYVERLPEGVSHVPIPSLTRAWDLNRDRKAASELLSVLRVLRLDVLHTHNPKSGVMGRILGRAARIPVVVNTCHGLWVRPEDGLARKGFVLGSEALAGLASDAELYQNDLDRQTLSRFVPSARAWTVGNGIDLDRFRRDAEAGARLRAALGISADALVVGGVGRTVAEKGIVELAEAARRLDREVEVIWVGPEDDTKSDRINSDLEGLRFVDEQRDMVAVYSALDVFVLPSHREGFSRSAMEAAACGCAMVLTDIRGCREVGTDGRHLLLVPPREPEALATAIGRLLDDAGLRDRLQEAAVERARQTFDQWAVAGMSIETYRRVALRKGLPWAVDAPRAPRDPWRRDVNGDTDG